MNSASIRQSLVRLALRRQPIRSSKRFSSSESQHGKAQDTLSKLSGKVFENAKRIFEPVSDYTGRLLGCVFIFPLLFILYCWRSVDASPTFFFSGSVQPIGNLCCTTSLWHEKSSSRFTYVKVFNPPIFLLSAPRIALSGLKSTPRA